MGSSNSSPADAQGEAAAAGDAKTKLEGKAGDEGKAGKKLALLEVLANVDSCKALSCLTLHSC